MAAALTTNNAKGIGYQTGFFSGDVGTPINQYYFDAAFAGRINTNKIYKEAYYCNIVGYSGMSQWLEEYMGYETDCHPAYTLLSTYGQYQQIKIAADATVPQYPGTVVLHLASNSHFVNSQFILPQVGNTIVTSPNGVLVEVTAISTASANDSTVTVRQRDKTGNTGAQAVKAGDELLVLSGSEIADCACPTGQFAFNDLPLETDLEMIQFGDLGSLCGDALNKCQFLKIPFYDDCGNVVDERWWTQPLADMYKRFEKRKHYEILLHQKFGLINVLRANAIKFVPASTTEITTDDVRYWKSQLDLNGVNCREYAIFAGGTLFSQWQRMLLSAGVTQLQYIDRPLADCGWINMEYCGLQVEGLRLHIYEEKSFSNGKELGSQNMVFPKSAIIVPMCERPACRRSNNRQESGSQDNKMLSMVYFKDNHGRTWDTLTDSNGVLGTRNTFGTGCEKQEWSVKTRFLLETHCPNSWGYMGL